MRDRDGGGPFRTLSRILFGALLLGAFVLFVLWRTENPRLAQARLALLDWAAPTLESVAGPSGAVMGLFEDVRSLSELQAENARLRERLARLERWRETARDLEQENARLRALAAVAPPVRSRAVTAEVVGDAGGPFAESLIVNVGRNDGIEDGAPALDARGLVGRVTGVAARAGRVLLLTDPASRVPVRIERADGGAPLRALLIGDGSPAPRLDHLGRDQGGLADLDASIDAVPLGARIETSGQGSVFPEGLFVGLVAEGADGAARAGLAADLERPTFLRVLQAADAASGRPAAPGVVNQPAFTIRDHAEETADTQPALDAPRLQP